MNNKIEQEIEMNRREKRLKKEDKNNDNVVRVINKWLKTGYSPEVVINGIWNKMGRTVDIKDNTIRLWSRITVNGILSFRQEIVRTVKI